MHLYLFVRGKFEQVEHWKAHAQGSYWKWRRINNITGKEETIVVQGALRPSVFGAYEYIFPKEALAEVCSFFGIDGQNWKTFGAIGSNLRHSFLRKLFGCKKIPKEILKQASEIPPIFTTEQFERACANCVIPGVAIHVIGIREDIQMIMGDYTQEAL